MGIAEKLTRDGWLLFATRCSRMFAYGLLSVVLVLYLVEVGLKEWEVGLLLSLTLAGDTAISLWLTTTADRFGRRRTLIVGAILMVLAGIAFVSTGNFLLLVIAATVGVISPSGNEIGHSCLSSRQRFRTSSATSGAPTYLLGTTSSALSRLPWEHWPAG